MPVSKEQFVTAMKKLISYAIIVGALVLGFVIGRYTQNYPPDVKPETNPYSKAFAPKEISIAVNESNELIMIERATGDYIVYSDEIGQTIFGMYANRIHQEVTNDK